MKFRTNFTIDWKLYNKLKDYKERSDISISSFVNRKMWEAIREVERKEMERLEEKREEN